MQHLFTVRIPFPFFESGAMNSIKKRNLLSLNNISKWRFKKTEIKNEYQRLLKEMYFPEPATKYDSLTFQYRIIRDSGIRFDQDNAIFVAKFSFDALEEMGYVKDDKTISLQTFPTIIDKSLPETMVEIRVLAGSANWDTPLPE